MLIDEYDRIVADTMPFLALPRSTLRSRQRAIARNENSHTFLVRDGEIKITGPKASLMRAKEQRELMLPFAQWLPDMDITMSAHDGPSVLMDARTRARHTDAASRGKILSVDEANEVDDDPRCAARGFAFADLVASGATRWRASPTRGCVEHSMGSRSAHCRPGRASYTIIARRWTCAAIPSSRTCTVRGEDFERL